jgi:hypothetical protein
MQKIARELNFGETTLGISHPPHPHIGEAHHLLSRPCETGHAGTAVPRNRFTTLVCCCPGVCSSIDVGCRRYNLQRECLRVSVWKPETPAGQTGV